MPNFFTETPRTKRSPARNALVLARVLTTVLTSALTVALVCGCGRSPVERLIDESVGHLEAAHRMLVDNAGNIEKLAIAVVQYRSNHRGDFRRLRLAGEQALKGLPPAKRKAVMDAARKRTTPLSIQIETAAGRYKDKRLAMRMVRPLMVTATAKGLAKGQRPPWQPKFKDLPHDSGGAGATGLAGHRPGAATRRPPGRPPAASTGAGTR